MSRPRHGFAGSGMRHRIHKEDDQFMVGLIVCIFFGWTYGLFASHEWRIFTGILWGCMGLLMGIHCIGYVVCWLFKRWLEE